MAETLHGLFASDNDAYGEWPITRCLNEPALAQRFWSKVDKALSDTGCWLWTSNTTGQLNHGQFHVGRFGGRTYNEYAHRLAWILTHGPIADGLQVNHHCDVPTCVNPDHLYLGTQLNNMRDAGERGRFPLTRQPRKLPDRSVHAIRVLADAGVPQVLIARAFAVTNAAISQIVNGARRIHSGWSA